MIKNNFRASGGSVPSPTPNNEPASQPITGGSNSSPQDESNQAESCEKIDEIIESLKTLKLCINDPKKKE